VRRRRAIGASVLAALTAGPILFAVVWVALEDRRQRLNHALVAAKKARDAKAATVALDQGADPNAPDVPYRPVTLKLLFAEVRARLSVRSQQTVGTPRPPAMTTIFGNPSMAIPDTSIAVVFSLDEGAGSDGWNSRDRSSAGPVLAAVLDHGASLRPRKSIGDLLLARACLCDDAGAVKTLLDHHADPNADYHGYPVLIIAQESGCLDLLLRHGADANARSADGSTRLM